MTTPVFTDDISSDGVCPNYSEGPAAERHYAPIVQLAIRTFPTGDHLIVVGDAGAIDNETRIHMTDVLDFVDEYRRNNLQPSSID